MSPERMGGYVPQEAAPQPPFEAVEAPPEVVELGEDQLKEQQTELHGQLVGMSKELMNAALKGETAKIVELTGKIEQIHVQFKDLDEKMKLAKERAATFKDLTKEEINLAVEPLNEFADLTEEEIDNAVSALGPEEEPILLTPDMMKPIEITDEMIISVEPIKPPPPPADAFEEPSETEQALDELRQMERERVAQEAAEKKETERSRGEVAESLAELRQIEKDRVAREAAEKPKDEVSESLAELREIERQRVELEKQGKWKPAEKPKTEVEESLDELRQIEKDRVAREAAEKAAAEKPPTTAEIKGILAKNELSPERKAVLERELQRMENQLFGVENGAELIDRETGKTVNKLGLKELESKFKKKFGLDLDQLAEKKSVSRWESFKTGLRSIFSREFRQTVRQYEERTREYNDLHEDIDLTKLQIEDPQKYAAIMDRRLLKIGLLNAKRRASANRPANPGIGTMKF